MLTHLMDIDASKDWNRIEYETFEKCQFLFKFKEDEKFNRRNIFDISRIKFWV